MIRKIYDIVKVHGRELKVDIKEGEGTQLKHSITSAMKNKFSSSFKSMMLSGVLLFLTTTVLHASTDSLFVVSGNQWGVGISINTDSVGTRIVQIFPNTPAERSGQLKVGDRIIGIGKTEYGEIIDIRGKSAQEVVDLISGPAGTHVRLAILLADNDPSDPPIIVELVREYIQRSISLNTATWYFKPGDNMEWADPNVDHVGWLKLNPSAIYEPLPDSLWSQGYGWFRTWFKADSTFYFNPWYLQIITWGAAEVYFDGKLYKRYGVFSTDPDLEQRTNPNQAFTPLWLAPKDIHLVAVRFSYHPAKRYKQIMAEHVNFGFGMHFQSQKSNELRNEWMSKTKSVFYLLLGIYSIIIILHGYLYYLFRKQKENLLVTLIVFILLCDAYLNFYFSFLDYDRLLLYRIVGLSEIFRLTALLLVPFTLVTFFNLQKFTKLKYLPVLAVPLYLLLKPFTLQENRLTIIVVPILILSFVLLYRAYNESKKGVGFVAFGFIGMLLLLAFGLFIEVITTQQLIPVSVITKLQLEEIFDSIFYTVSMLSVLPLSMTFFIAYKMGKLYTGLEGIVKERTEALEISLSDLKASQAQLIQSEKMASLGELTAGIAHEIQNPLNFVNNFSEVNEELLAEMKDELDKGNVTEAKSIANDAIENQQKILHHGRRADSIVKGMLQHSRSSSGVKEPTDINALADEYLRLAYHGLRAKDKSFNATMKTDFDESIGKINVVPQDIGRVVLNLITNAFYAVTERKKQEGDNFEPTVSVITKKTGDKVLISVKDNGNGIPDSIKEKIFQPFFTTKPTGQGTGLGLSLSYDIVKAHGGELSVETREGEGSEFIIRLPGV
ncbi:MAG: PDZ domain-containing protein [Cyclobacteriaceae bacterium]|nr:PDZ domain-containing protein [Cyclobacteriaceae bacterium]